MTKTENIFALSGTLLREMNSETWAKFLKTAGYQFRFSFSSQLLIYAQRPNATACGTFEFWNKKMNRRINRGAKGIALIDDDGDQMKLDYVFDASDTSSPTGEPVPEWFYTSEKEPVIRAALAAEFLDDATAGEEDSLPEFCKRIADALSDEQMEKIMQSAALRGSTLAADVPNAEEIIHRLLSRSVMLTLLYRFGQEPEQPAQLFEQLNLLNTEDAISLLGVWQQHITENVLRVAAKTVRAWDKREERHEKDNLSAVRGVSDSQRDAAAPAAIESLRETAQEVPERESTGVVRSDAADRPAAAALGGSGSGGVFADGAGAIGAVGERSGTKTGNVSVGAAYGEDSYGSRGTGASDSDLRITPEDLAYSLRGGGGVEYSKERIYRAYTRFADDKTSERTKDLVSWLKKEYGFGGGSIYYPDGVHGWVDHNGAGYRLKKGSAEKTFSWSAVSKALTTLIADGKYMTGEELAGYPAWLRSEEANAARYAASEQIEKFYTANVDPHLPTAVSGELRKWVYENSEKARLSLLSLFGSLAERDEICGNADAVADLTAILNSLGKQTETQLLPSAADAGLTPEFPTQEEQVLIGDKMPSVPQSEINEILSSHLWTADEKKAVLNFVQGPQSDLDCFAAFRDLEPRNIQLFSGEQVALEPTAAGFIVTGKQGQELIAWQDVLHGIRSLRDSGQFQSAPKILSAQDAQPKKTQVGDTVLLNGLAYLVTKITEQTVELQDVQHPIFTPVLSKASFDCILSAFTPSAEIMPETSAKPVETPEKEHDVKEIGHTDDFSVKEPTVTNGPASKLDSLNSIGPGKMRRTQNEKNYDFFARFAPAVLDGTFDYLQFESDGYEPLYLEHIGSNFYAMAHTFTQNGDLMFDPEITFILDRNAKTFRPCTYQQSGVGKIFQEIYAPTDEGYQHPNLALERDVNTFVKQWILNIFAQEFVPVRATAFRPDGNLEYVFQDGVAILQGGEQQQNHSDEPVVIPPAEPKAVSEPEEIAAEEISEEEKIQEQQIAISAEPVPMRAPAEEISERVNYHMDVAGQHLGGPKARYQTNVAAIRLLKELENESRLAAPQEQEILSKYVGWGGLPQAFDSNNAQWQEEYEQLHSLLSESEYASARESTLTAFYTPPVVMRSIYQILENMGFHRGNILEPACGTGNFFGMLPESLSESKLYGVELDSISGRIARQLYQNSNIAIEGYEKTDFPDNFFDIAVGNVPFGQFKVSDHRYDKNNFLIHDFFFAKTLDKVRPGGVVAFITSRGTMDKENGSVRKYLAQRAVLLGAVRLPNNVFHENAGTDVTSDILFLQKRERPSLEETNWVGLEHLVNPDQTLGPIVNSYFAQHPEMILGDLKEVSGPHGPELTCAPKEGADLAAELHRACQSITGSINSTKEIALDEETAPTQVFRPIRMSAISAIRKLTDLCILEKIRK